MNIEKDRKLEIRTQQKRSRSLFPPPPRKYTTEMCSLRYYTWSSIFNGILNLVWMNLTGYLTDQKKAFQLKLQLIKNVETV